MEQKYLAIYTPSNKDSRYAFLKGYLECLEHKNILEDTVAKDCLLDVFNISLSWNGFGNDEKLYNIIKEYTKIYRNLHQGLPKIKQMIHFISRSKIINLEELEPLLPKLKDIGGSIYVSIYSADPETFTKEKEAVISS